MNAPKENRVPCKFDFLNEDTDHFFNLAATITRPKAKSDYCRRPSEVNSGHKIIDDRLPRVSEEFSDEEKIIFVDDAEIEVQQV